MNPKGTPQPTTTDSVGFSARREYFTVFWQAMQNGMHDIFDIAQGRLLLRFVAFKEHFRIL
jgi:hypothetical protein